MLKTENPVLEVLENDQMVSSTGDNKISADLREINTHVFVHKNEVPETRWSHSDDAHNKT